MCVIKYTFDEYKGLLTKIEEAKKKPKPAEGEEPLKIQETGAICNSD